MASPLICPFRSDVTTFHIGRKRFQPLEGRFAGVIWRGRVRIPPRHIGGGCLPLNGEMVLLIEKILCQPSMSAGSWSVGIPTGGYKTLSNHRRAQASLGLEHKLLSKLLGQFGQLLFYVHSNSCAEFTTKQNELRFKVSTVQKQDSRNLAFGFGSCECTYRMVLARTRAETIHLVSTPIPPPCPQCVLCLLSE